MLDHVFVTVSDVRRSIAFYEQALAPLGIGHVLDYDGKNGPPGHPDLKGFGRDGRVFFWLRPGNADSRATHVGFVASSVAEVDAFHVAAIAAGATDNGAPGPRLHYVRATTLPMSSIPTATVSKLSTSPGSIPPGKAFTGAARDLLRSRPLLKFHRGERI
jgi:catechol 2,3-dioxygenase-like lactoylglutathione lyase family enzyme